MDSNRILEPKTNGNELIPDSRTNSLYSIVKEIELILYLGTINSTTDKNGGVELVPNPRINYKIVSTILDNYDFNQVMIYFINFGAATSAILMSKLGLPRTSVFNYISQLGQWGIISPTKKARSGFSTGNRESGRIPDIWQTPEATTDQVFEAIQLHKRLKFPKYNFAETLAQSILNDYLLPRHREETTMKDIKELIEKKGVSKAEMYDLTNFVCKYLGEAGIKVWR